jgi:hypothetical protein
MPSNVAGISPAELLDERLRPLVELRWQHDLELNHEIAGVRSRSRWPDWTPRGTRSRAGPSSVGTSIRAPSAASWTATGTVTMRSRPSRRNTGSGVTSRVT